MKTEKEHQEEYPPEALVYTLEWTSYPVELVDTFDHDTCFPLVIRDREGKLFSTRKANLTPLTPAAKEFLEQVVPGC